MPFYKRNNEELMVAPNFVVGPGFELQAESHTEHTYPVEGWYWFDTLDDAMAAFAPQPVGVSPRQIRQAMNRTPYGASTLRDAVEAVVHEGGRDLQDWWEFSTIVDRNHPQVLTMAAALSVDDDALNDLWQLAATL